jgi:hypothetical protein
MIEQLANAIKSGNQKELLRCGVQVQIWKTDMESKLEKQFNWLDPVNMSNPKYEQRFIDWTQNLEEYKRACRLLDEAKGML